MGRFAEFDQKKTHHFGNPQIFSDFESEYKKNKLSTSHKSPFVRSVRRLNTPKQSLLRFAIHNAYSEGQRNRGLKTGLYRLKRDVW